MASKLVKNATAPTPAATTAMPPTTAAWKRRSHASAAWTLPSTMLGLELKGGWGLTLMARLPSTVTARPLGRAARIVMGQGASLQLGAIGVIRLGQLPPAGVVAQQPRQVGVALADPALPVDPLQVVALGLVAVDRKRRADLAPAMALLTGVTHDLPLPAGHGLDDLAVGAQRLQRRRPLGPLRVLLERRQRVLVALLAGLSQRGAHGVGHRPGLPGLPSSSERVLGQLLGCLLLVGAWRVVRRMLSAHGRPPFHWWSARGRVGVAAVGTAQRQAADGSGRRSLGSGSAQRAGRAAAGGPARAPARRVW